MRNLLVFFVLVVLGYRTLWVIVCSTQYICTFNVHTYVFAFQIHCTLHHIHSHEKVSALLLILAIKQWFINTLKSVLRFEKLWFFDNFLLEIKGNAFKRVFVQKYQLTLVLQGFKVWDLKKRAFYYVKLKTSNFDNL